ncbi:MULTISPECIES: LPXTG cell wall anchor domain-containing protein [unclassified Isoptericola]|uniref:LPXTG cell wall anchor domain-containing protein n=1 Tax=Isoptericola sp. NPDC057191 TaxID=3346041 RepID=UPI00363A7AC1
MAHARYAAGVAVGLLLSAGAALAVATPAGAATETPDPSSSPSSTGYEQPEVPTLTAQIFEPVCDGDVPYLRYAVTATGTPNTTVTITWINPDGDDVVQPDLPLSGRVLWPGAVVDAAGNPLDWPGWRLEDGVWVEGDEFDWVRPSVQVKMQVNPELTMTANYPPSSPNCATNPPGVTPSPTPTPGVTVPGAVPPEAAPPGSPTPGFLPQTGAGVAGLVAAAAGLAAAGGIAVAAARRRRSTDH